MCRKLVVVNELYLGNRQLGFETFSLPKGELLEFTSKQLKDIMKQGKDEVYGLELSETNELAADTEHFFCSNWMVKSHINSLTPKFESESMANIFYIVIGAHKEKGGMVYDMVSSRYERAGFTEEKTKTLLEMGIISAGAKLQDGKIIVAPLEKQQQEEHEEQEKEAVTATKKETVKTKETADKKEPAKEEKKAVTGTTKETVKTKETEEKKEPTKEEKKAVAGTIKETEKIKETTMAKETAKTKATAGTGK